uniref:Ketoreductase (KR) domain-containing protein n=1 Tax=Chrysotila carterae TaxID=13221 RepID=A0A7S4ESW7_CHRCT
MAAAKVPSLLGSVTWVVGGVGIVGRGIAGALLRAGSIVIVNSRFPGRLEALNEDLGYPENLVSVHGTMLPGGAAETLEKAMQRTGNRLDHVVAHSAVRWWANHAGDESSTLAAQGGGSSGLRLLSFEPSEFISHATQLASLHYTAAHSLLPRMTGSPNRPSYTFVTGGGGALHTAWGPRSAIGQVNAHAVWGLSAALRCEVSESNWPVRVSELRVGLRLNRPASERAIDPRETPLSNDIGEIVAGIAAAAPTTHEANELYTVSDSDEVQKMKQRFPVATIGYSVYFRPE